MDVLIILALVWAAVVAQQLESWPTCQDAVGSNHANRWHFSYFSIISHPILLKADVLSCPKSGLLKRCNRCIFTHDLKVNPSWASRVLLVVLVLATVVIRTTKLITTIAIKT